MGVLVASRLTSRMVYGIVATCPSHLGAALAVMVWVALAAVIVPVVRATRVSPLAALRRD